MGHPCEFQVRGECSWPVSGATDPSDASFTPPGYSDFTPCPPVGQPGPGRPVNLTGGGRVFYRRCGDDASVTLDAPTEGVSAEKVDQFGAALSF